ncbi:MAG: glycosyltransferase [Chlorobium sp.]|uniref:glycosyltransferase n=1 Tax=Chlorobium sp. TaxID=1095 RepID=UPI0025BA4E60|nr:glycosyltransferase [Chlorobium sp.]MCF8384106.1 glycosyltransferase [Chlorobium sp.]
MNFLFLNSARNGWGGNEKWTLLATGALAKKNGVFLAYRDPLLGERFSVKKFRLPFIAEIDPLTLFGLVRIILRERIDVLIPTKRKDYVLAGLASRMCGTANILRLGIDRPMKDSLLQKLIYDTFTDGIIVNAEKIKRTLQQTSWIMPDKIRVIYNGLDCREMEKSSHENYPEPFAFTIISAGTLIARKGFDFLLRSFARFLELTPGAQAGLVIAGDGPQREELEHLAGTLNIGEKVLFTGFLQNPYPLMKTSDVFVSTSKSEGLSNALIEGMFLECVPVSTFSGGASEIIEEDINGFLVSYGDQEKLAAILSELYLNPAKRRAVAVAAHRTVSQKFSIFSMEQEIFDFCTETRSKQQDT